MSDVKVTKKNVLEALASLDFTEDVVVGDVTVTPDDIKNYIDTALTQLENRAAKAAEKQAEKKAEGDTLRADIKAVLGETPKTIAEIVAELNDDTVTNAKVVARLGQLVKLGEVFKSDVKAGDRTVKAYSTVPVDAE